MNIISFWSRATARRSVALLLAISLVGGYFTNVTPVQAQEAPEQCVIVSDDTTLEDGQPADELTFVHPNWNHDLEPAAAWIWGDNPVVDSSVDETQVFTKTFSLQELPASATLTLASDNGYLVKVNTVQQGTNELANPGNTFNPTTTIPVTGLIAGTNTLEITVFNKGGDANPQNNPAGLIFRLTVDGSNCGEPPVVDTDPVNTCIVPEASDETVVIGVTPEAEETLQELLDGEYGANAPDAATEQENFQSWSGTGNSVDFTVENLSQDSNSAHTHVFGYYLNGGSFTPVFREGTVGAPYAAVPELSVGNSASFSTAVVNDIVFAIADWDGSVYTYFATDDSMNFGGEAHALSYNIADNEYAIAFEDLVFAAGDEDYNDVVVSLHVDSCEGTAVCETGEELLANGDFENVDVTAGAQWDIFQSGTIDWIAQWLGVPALGRPDVANLEVQESGLNGWTASTLNGATGDQWTELDTDWGGPTSGQSGEASQIAISQTVPTVPGESYTLTFDFSPRPGTAAGENKVEVLANDDVIGTVGPLAATGAQTEWTAHTYSFIADSYATEITFRDAGSTNDSFGTFVDNASLSCEAPPETATLVATKIVCPTEEMLPNWGAGGVVSEITADTAADFLEENESCYLAPNWDFQWATDATGDPEDNGSTPLEAPWATFTTDETGTVSTEVPVDANIRVREVLKEGYIPFTGQVTDQPVSAEFYCSTDVLHYDNWVWIDGTEDETYYCVAFNAPIDEGGACDVSASNILLSSDSEEGELLTEDEDGPASIVGEFLHTSWVDAVDALWIWKDAGTSNEDAADGTTETFTRTFEIIGTPLDSTLELAADNSYVVKVNNQTVCDDDGEFNYGDTTDCAVPASVLINGTNTITFEVTNMDHETENTPETNPAGLLYKLTVNENECVMPPAQFSTVTMCKVNENEEPLSGWTLTLAGTHIEDLVVPSTNVAGIDTVNSLEGGMSYIASALGTWTNQWGANIVDAEYSTTDGWTTWMDGYTTYQTDILELQINEAFDPNSDWSPYSPAHAYAQSFTQAADGTANFRVFDGSGTTANESWYADNSGTLAVSLSEGYAGVTGQNGCVTFTDVPYGAYTAGELAQSGWNYVSTSDGDNELEGETVNVNSASETFTIMNNDVEGNDDVGTLIIEKTIMNEDDGVFTFDIFGTNASQDVQIATEEGNGSSTISLPVGTYAVTEDAQDGWVMTNVSCEQQDNEEDVPMPNNAVVIEDGETVICTFTNVMTDEEEIPVTVTPSNMQGWYFFPEGTFGGQTGQMVTGPGSAPIGDGSAELAVTTNTEGEVLGMFDLAGTRFDDIVSLGYSTYRATAGVALPALQFEFDPNLTDAVTTYSGRLVYEPYLSQVVSSGVWQTWNPMNNNPAGNWWFSDTTVATASGCTMALPCTWAEVQSIYPDGGIRDAGIFTGATLFKVGSGGGVYTGNVDKFVIGIQNGYTTTTTTYDFEPNETTPPGDGEDGDGEGDGEGDGDGNGGGGGGPNANMVNNPSDDEGDGDGMGGGDGELPADDEDGVGGGAAFGAFAAGGGAGGDGGGIGEGDGGAGEEDGGTAIEDEELDSLLASAFAAFGDGPMAWYMLLLLLLLMGVSYGVWFAFKKKKGEA